MLVEKLNFLTTTGQLTLAKSRLNAIPINSMQYFSLPKKICNTVDKIQGDFLWGTTAQKRRMHYVSWEKVASQKILLV